MMTRSLFTIGFAAVVLTFFSSCQSVYYGGYAREATAPVYAPYLVYGDSDPELPPFNLRRTFESAPFPPTLDHRVLIFDDYYKTQTIEIEPGDSVRWVNGGRHRHTVTALDGSWDSGAISPGGFFSKTFFEEGSFAFYCRYHRNMRGMVVVRAGTIIEER